MYIISLFISCACTHRWIWILCGSCCGTNTSPGRSQLGWQLVEPLTRSMIYVSFLFLMLALFVQLGKLPKEFQGRHLWIQKSEIEVDGNVMTFEHFVKTSGKNWTTHSPEAFFDYSRVVYTGMFAKIIRQTSTIDIFELCANTSCQIARCICLWLGLHVWCAARILGLSGAINNLLRRDEVVKFIHQQPRAYHITTGDGSHVLKDIESNIHTLCKNRSGLSGLSFWGATPVRICAMGAAQFGER